MDTHYAVSASRSSPDSGDVMTGFAIALVASLLLWAVIGAVIYAVV